MSEKWNRNYIAARDGWQALLEKIKEENRQLAANLETANTNWQLLETSLNRIQAERDRLQRELTEAASRPASELKKVGEENRKLVADLETANKGMQLLQTSLGRAEAERDRLQTALTESHGHLRGVNLEKAHLEGAILMGAHLEHANLEQAHLFALLEGAHLEGANLSMAQLKHADLDQAHLEGANLMGAQLEHAYLQKAHLEHAYLGGTNLQGASLQKAHLESALFGGRRTLGEFFFEGRRTVGESLQIAPGPRLEGADLFGAKGLTQEQLENSSGDEETVLPEGLERPAHWKVASEEPDNNI